MESGDAVADVIAAWEGLRGVVDDGEPVDEYSHAGQTAALALAAGADDELVAAALLHDIGRSPAVARPGVPHEVAAQEFLAPRLGARVAWLAGAHVDAKRYLVATDPAYRAALSDVSTASLRSQGEALPGRERTGHPWWPDAVAVRRWDDLAKKPGAPLPDPALLHRILRALA